VDSFLYPGLFYGSSAYLLHAYCGFLLYIGSIPYLHKSEFFYRRRVKKLNKPDFSVSDPER
jgi:hypothetical protein